MLDIASLTPHPIVIAIGDNKSRKRIVEEFEKLLVRVKWFTVVHPRASLTCTTKIGERAFMAAGATVTEDVVIGRHCIVNTNATGVCRLSSRD